MAYYNRQSLVLWNCQECHGTYPMKISDKTPDNTDCPYCNNIKLLPAFNDLRTVYPELAAKWSENKNFFYFYSISLSCTLFLALRRRSSSSAA
ncbi:zinc-ribbon domain-containing protein [Clostridium fessum]|uniref:zinc-ribbon domain-containing protein n=1 Tax=Clostridium fessum TaxID=2126740 RepID=UPI00399105CC